MQIANKHSFNADQSSPEWHIVKSSLIFVSFLTASTFVKSGILIRKIKYRKKLTYFVDNWI
jgi:hypothetical protein